jgi:hypothetical protein
MSHKDGVPSRMSLDKFTLAAFGARPKRTFLDAAFSIPAAAAPAPYRGGAADAARRRPIAVRS